MFESVKARLDKLFRDHTRSDPRAYLAALRDALLEAKVAFTYFAVTKKVGAHSVIQFERLLGEVTSHVRSGFVRVSRDGVSSRFLPCKDNEELALRRPEIEGVLRSRGVIT